MISHEIEIKRAVYYWAGLFLCFSKLINRCAGTDMVSQPLFCPLGLLFFVFRFFFCGNTPLKIVNALIYKKYGNNEFKVMFYHQSDFDYGQALHN